MIKALWLRKGHWERARRRGSAVAPSGLDSVDQCIAVKRDLWFEGLGFPHPANACQGPNPWRKPQRQKVASACRSRAEIQHKQWLS
jgi:hypothetical protein